MRMDKTTRINQMIKTLKTSNIEVTKKLVTV